MMEYQVLKGDTIAGVTSRLNTNWETLRKNNPQSIGKAGNGNWFLKEGATITAENSFNKSLQKARKRQHHLSLLNQFTFHSSRQNSCTVSILRTNKSCHHRRRVTKQVQLPTPSKPVRRYGTWQLTSIMSISKTS